jgi:hypothetical protein
MNTLVETYKQAVSDIETFVNEIQPIAARFFDFIQKTDADGYLDVSIPEVASKNWLPLKYYSMEIIEDAATMDGVYFEAEDWDCGERVIFHFVIPYDYIENPDAWQIAFVKRIADEKKAALDAFYKMFPNAGQDHRKNDLNVTVYPADIFLNEDYLTYNASYNASGYYFEYEGFTYNSRLLYYRISTGEIFLVRDYADRLKMLDGQSFPPLLKPLTKEQWEAQVEAEKEDARRERIKLDERTLVSLTDRAARKRQKQF